MLRPEEPAHESSHQNGYRAKVHSESPQENRIATHPRNGPASGQAHLFASPSSPPEGLSRICESVMFWVSRPGEFHPKPLAEPCVNLSIYTAPIIQPDIW